MNETCKRCGEKKHRKPKGHLYCPACHRRYLKEAYRLEDPNKVNSRTIRAREERKTRDPWIVKIEHATKSFEGRGGWKDLLLMKLYSQQMICPLTGRRLLPETTELDHITPKSRGGANDYANTRWVHKSANQAKHNLTDEEFLQLCWEVVRTTGQHLLEDYCHRFVTRQVS